MQSDLSFHPAANIFPLLDGASFAELVADIRENGLLEPICLHEGQILDGRNRYRACREAGVDPTFTTWGGEGTEVAYVVSMNLRRRHLNESQRAMVAVNLANMGEGRPSETASIEAVSQRDAADMLNVSRSSVQRAKRVRETGAPELITAVEGGELSLGTASVVAAQPQKVQAEVVKMPKRQRKPFIDRVFGGGRIMNKQEAEHFRKTVGWMHDFEEALRYIAAMPVAPEEYAKNIPDHMKAAVQEMLEPAQDWLVKFGAEWRKQNGNAT